MTVEQSKSTKPAEEFVVKAAARFNNSRSRSTFFLALSALIILLLNGILPVIEGDAHYTASPIEVTFERYLELKEEDGNHRLTYTSERAIANYIARVIRQNPDLTVEEQVLLKAPPAFPVEMYTRFFYQHVFWWVSTAVSIASAILLFYNVFNYLIVRLKETDPKYLRLKSEVEDAVDKNVDPNTFDPWLEYEFNRKRKIQQHRANVRNSIQALDNKVDFDTKRKLRLYFEKYSECIEGGKEPVECLPTIVSGLTKEGIKYKQEKERLLSLLDPHYITQYVVDAEVKYFKKIHGTFVYSGENIEKINAADSYSAIKTDTARVAGDIGRKAVLILSVTIMFAVLLTITAVASVGKSPLWIMANIVAKIAPLIIQVPLAFDYTNRFMQVQIMPNLYSRRNICLLYFGSTKLDKKDWGLLDA